MAGRLEIDGLAKTRGRRTVLDEVTVSVPAGQRAAIVGPPGAGKTTMGRILAGLEPPTSGSVRVDGHDVVDDAHVRKQVGYVAARPGLDEQRTPRELLRTAGGLHGLTASETERRLEETLIALELEHLGGHAIEHLADGMRARVALGYALMADPDVLVVDEPSLGLAPEATRRMREAINAQAEGRTLLALTSEPGDAERLCERVIGLEDGQIVVDAGVDELAGEEGVAVRVELAGPLPQAALDEAREHAAIGALRRDPEEGEDLELWITDRDRQAEVLAVLVDAGAPVASFARREPGLGELVAEHMEGPL